MRVRSPFTFTAVCKECDVVLTDSCVYEPDVPPYPTMNPDDPRYADPGSPSSVDDYPETCPGCGLPVDVEDLFKQGESAFTDWAEAAAEDAAERKYDEMRERDWDKYDK